MNPSVGRIVHYYRPTLDRTLPPPRAAIITQVEEHSVMLELFGPGDDRFASAFYAEQPTPGCWSWPPRA